MVIDGYFVMTEEEIRNQRKDALLAYEEATEKRNRLILKLRDIGRRAAALAVEIQAIEDDPEKPLQSEVRLLMLTQSAFDGIDHGTVRALANSIAAARKEVAEAIAAKRALFGK